jgi:hypothetical protein
MRIEWTSDAVADFEHISTWIKKERTLALANRVCRRIYGAVQAPKLETVGKEKTATDFRGIGLRAAAGPHGGGGGGAGTGAGGRTSNPPGAYYYLPQTDETVLWY